MRAKNLHLDVNITSQDWRLEKCLNIKCKKAKECISLNCAKCVSPNCRKNSNLR